jgi:DNA-binding NarL/FixJ family response regulator
MRHVDAPRLLAGAESALAVPRGDGAELLDHAVRLDAMGMPWQASRLADTAVSILARQSSTRRAEAVMLAGRLRDRLGIPAPTDTQTVPLTTRELEITALAAAGLSDREIARRLSLSARTVQSHLSRIYRKLGVHSRRDLPSGLRNG